MKHLPEIFEKNAAWAKQMEEDNPGFFKKLEDQQSPKYLWIGCSDSRVPANQICGLEPGSVFVHRNIANVVEKDDLNCMSVVQFAVEVLKVEHIIVCGHYGCGGVAAALEDKSLGAIDSWIKHIKLVALQSKSKLDKISNSKEKLNLLCDLNVKAQVKKLCATEVVEKAWDRGQSLAIHAWVYSLGDGRLVDLGVCVKSKSELDEIID